MKKNLLWMAAGLLALAACSDDETRDLGCTAGEEARFTANITPVRLTRVGDTTWDSGDQAGIFQNNAGNVPYNVGTDGTMTPAGNDAIYYLESGNHFTTYYPYSTSASNGTLVFSTSDANHDILWASAEPTENVVNFTYVHKLTKVVIDFSGFPHTVKSVKLGGQYTTAVLDISTGEVRLSDTQASANGTVTFGTTDNEKEWAAIVIPTSVNSATVAERTLTVTTETDRTFTFTLGSDVTFENGTKVTFQATANVDANLQPSTITDWTASEGGSINFTETEGEGGEEGGEQGGEQGGDETSTYKTYTNVTMGAQNTDYCLFDATAGTFVTKVKANLKAFDFFVDYSSGNAAMRFVNPSNASTNGIWDKFSDYSKTDFNAEDVWATKVRLLSPDNTTDKAIIDGIGSLTEETIITYISGSRAPTANTANLSENAVVAFQNDRVAGIAVIKSVSIDESTTSNSTCVADFYVTTATITTE